MIPLSTRMRPDNLDDFVGQEHFLYKGSLLYNAIKNGTFESAIFFGQRFNFRNKGTERAYRQCQTAFLWIGEEDDIRIYR